MYDLKAVLIHRGPTAYSGHYIAHICSHGDGGAWYKFNDEEIQKMEGRNLKLGSEDELCKDITRGVLTNFLSISVSLHWFQFPISLSWLVGFNHMGLLSGAEHPKWHWFHWNYCWWNTPWNAVWMIPCNFIIKGFRSHFQSINKSVGRLALTHDMVCIAVHSLWVHRPVSFSSSRRYVPFSDSLKHT